MVMDDKGLHIHCIESIACLDGQLLNIRGHQKRINDTLLAVYGVDTIYNLKDIIVPNHCEKGLFKCRIVYSHKHFAIDFLEYIKKKNKHIALVHTNSINYPFKYENRDEINRLLSNAKSKFKPIDDILIVKNNVVTDMSFANVALKKNDTWYTPKHPLLNGTYSQYLIEKQQIIPAVIVVQPTLIPYDFLVSDFDKIKPINALLRWTHKSMPLDGIVNLT